MAWRSIRFRQWHKALTDDQFCPNCIPKTRKSTPEDVLPIYCTLIFLALLLYAEDQISNRFPHVESSTCTSQPKVKSSSAKGDFQLTGSQARLFLIHKGCVEGATVCVRDCVWSKEIQDFYSISSIGGIDGFFCFPNSRSLQAKFDRCKFALLKQKNFQPLVRDRVTAETIGAHVPRLPSSRGGFWDIPR